MDTIIIKRKKTIIASFLVFSDKTVCANQMVNLKNGTAKTEILLLSDFWER